MKCLKYSKMHFAKYLNFKNIKFYTYKRQKCVFNTGKLLQGIQCMTKLPLWVETGGPIPFTPSPPPPNFLKDSNLFVVSVELFFLFLPVPVPNYIMHWFDKYRYIDWWLWVAVFRIHSQGIGPLTNLNFNLCAMAVWLT